MPQGNGWWSFAWQGGREDRWRRPDLASDQKPKWSRAWHGCKLEAQLRRQGRRAPMAPKTDTPKVDGTEWAGGTGGFAAPGPGRDQGGRRGGGARDIQDTQDTQGK